jgi:hypothetical protein
MRGASQVGESRSLLLRRMMIAVLGGATAVLLAIPSAAQRHGPPTTNTVGGHFLAPPPSVLSVSGQHLPPPLPSVTSIPNYGYTNFGYTTWYPYGGYGNGYRGRHGYGRGYGSSGLAYAVPYYIPVDGNGYDYAGGPDLYSGPPIGPTDPILHMVAEQPPARYLSADLDNVQEPAPQTQPSQEQSAAREAKPNEPSVLIFRDGHHQEVANYAIMGQTVYVFDRRTQKIALADLDVPATIKANDDRGLEFRLPPQKPAQRKADLELKVPPDPGTTAPANIASIAP